ncbi:MAG: TraR/DksA C4-type zinc finger protein [Sedimentisphaerales bacterium]|nr:TraR/DksA C4-type zinc finger protein [Sedimentisphaerales bacterium]
MVDQDSVGNANTYTQADHADMLRSPLTPEQIEHFKQLLLDKRNELLQNVMYIEQEGLKRLLQGSGDLSSIPVHMADLGSDNYQQELAAGLVDGERQLLYEIDRALERIEQGTYGICEGTGKPIPLARLEAMPWARYCIEYERMIEEGKVDLQ